MHQKEAFPRAVVPETTDTTEASVEENIRDVLDIVAKSPALKGILVKAVLVDVNYLEGGEGSEDDFIIARTNFVDMAREFTMTKGAADEARKALVERHSKISDSLKAAATEYILSIRYALDDQQITAEEANRMIREIDDGCAKMQGLIASV